MSCKITLEGFLSRFGSLYEAAGNRPQKEKLKERLSKKGCSELDLVLDILWEHPDLSFSCKVAGINKRGFQSLLEGLDVSEPGNVLQDAHKIIQSKMPKSLDGTLLDKKDIVAELWSHPEIATYCKMKGCTRKNFTQIVCCELEMDDPALILEETKALICSGVMDSLNFDLEAYIKKFAVHFTSKLVHSQAKKGGVRIGKKIAKKTPYLCVSSIMSYGEEISLDQSHNDPDGVYQVLLKKYNSYKDMSPEDFRELSIDDQNVVECFSGAMEMNDVLSEEVNMDSLDAFLKQIVLPDPNNHGKYLALTPLVSPGLCKCIFDRYDKGRQAEEKWGVARSYDLLPFGGSNAQNTCIISNIRHVSSPFLAYVPSVRTDSKRVLRFLHTGADSFHFQVNKTNLLAYHKWLLSNRESSSKSGTRSLADESGRLAQRVESSFLREIVKDYVIDIKKMSGDILNLLKNEEMRPYLEKKGWVEGNGWTIRFLSGLNDLDYFIVTGISKSKTQDVLVENVVGFIDGYKVTADENIVLSATDKGRVRKVLSRLIKEVM